MPTPATPETARRRAEVFWLGSTKENRPNTTTGLRVNPALSLGTPPSL